jgi:hypothetical protein
MAAVQPVLQRMTPAEKARFVKKCNAKGVNGKTAKGVVKGVDKGRGKAGYVSAVVVAVVALVGVGAYTLRRVTLDQHSNNDAIQQRQRQRSPRIDNYDELAQHRHRPMNNDEAKQLCEATFTKQLTEADARIKRILCNERYHDLRQKGLTGECILKRSTDNKCTYNERASQFDIDSAEEMDYPTTYDDDLEQRLKALQQEL